MLDTEQEVLPAQVWPGTKLYDKTCANEGLSTSIVLQG